MPPALIAADDWPAQADRLPTLTEVVDFDTPMPTPAPQPDGDAVTGAGPIIDATDDATGGEPADASAEAPNDAPNDAVAHEARNDLAAQASVAQPAPAAPADDLLQRVDLDDVAAAVLAQLQARIDPLLQARLREALAPALARAAELVIREARDEVAQALRAMVAEAVQQALARRPHRP